MARIVNTDTTLGRRAALHRVWLTALCAVAVALAVNLVRGVLGELGGVAHLREVGPVAAACSAASHVFTFPGGHLPPPHSLRDAGMLLVHLVGLGAIGELVWLPLTVLRSHSHERRVMQELGRLPDEFWVLSDLRVPAARLKFQVDHVVVSPYGLWCVETRAYPGRITGAEYDYEWVQLRHRRTGQRQARRFFNPVRENASHCASIGDHLTRHRLETAVRSMVVFTAAEVETMTMTAVESLENMVHTILTAAETRVHEAHEVERIVGVLAGLVATSPRSRGEDAAATEAARLGAA